MPKLNFETTAELSDILSNMGLKNIFSNKKLTLGVSLILLVQIIVLITPISKYFIVPNIKINYILITIGICFIMFILGELVKPVYTKLFKDYREVKNEK